MFFTHYKNECQCQIKAFGISLLTWWREERSYFGRHNFCGRNLLHFGNTIFWKVTAIIKINRSLIYNGKFWSIRNKIKFIQIQCPPLNRITLGQHKSDNNNRMIQLTDLVCVHLRYNGPAIYDYNTRLILLTVIQLSGGHCIKLCPTLLQISGIATYHNHAIYIICNNILCNYVILHNM